MMPSSCFDDVVIKKGAASWRLLLSLQLLLHHCLLLPHIVNLLLVLSTMVWVAARLRTICAQQAFLLRWLLLPVRWPRCHHGEVWRSFLLSVYCTRLLWWCRRDYYIVVHHWTIALVLLLLQSWGEHINWRIIMLSWCLFSFTMVI